MLESLGVGPGTRASDTLRYTSYPYEGPPSQPPVPSDGSGGGQSDP